MLPLELWCQASPRGPHLVKTALLRMVWQDRLISAQALAAQMGNLYGMRAGQKTINHRLLCCSYCACIPTRKPLLTANCRRLAWSGQSGGRTWQWPIGSMSPVFGDKSRFQLYLVNGRLRLRPFPGECVQHRCQAYRVQAGGGSVHVWRAFHSGAKSPLVLPDRSLTSELYRSILWHILVPFARHYFVDNYHYQDDNAIPHHAWVVLDLLQQGKVTKMEQPARSPDCIPIDHIWDELGHAITSMDNLPKNLGELHQSLLDKWAATPVECLQRLVASMPRCLATIIASRVGNIQYWPGMHKTIPTGSIIQKKIRFVWPDSPQLPSNDIWLCSCSQFPHHQ